MRNSELAACLSFGMGKRDPISKTELEMKVTVHPLSSGAWWKTEL